MTTEHEVTRTLVKSPPELWAECSDAASLARHIGEFAEIRITRLEPETAVAWDGERASGTVRIEPSGWGTRVTLTMQTKADEEEGISEHDSVKEEPDATMEATLAQPDPAVASDPIQGRRRWARLIDRTRAWFRPSPGQVDPIADPITDDDLSLAPPEAPAPPPDPCDASDPDAILTAALDSLGQAHHRPFSRA
jgi:hypothetical protein